MRDTTGGSWWKTAYKYGSNLADSVWESLTPETPSFLNISSSPRQIDIGLRGTGGLPKGMSYDNPNNGWGWLDTAYDYAKTGWDYLGDAAGWLKDQYQDLPKGIQDYLKGRFVTKGDQYKRDRPRAIGKRMNAGIQAHKSREHGSRQYTRFGGKSNNVYGETPLAKAIIKNASEIADLRDTSMRQIAAGSQTITISQARNAVYTYLSRRST
jgi:hypothetical protein